MDIFQKLASQKIITPPEFLLTNTQYLCITGSQAYGVNRADSDIDIYGFAIPPKHYLLPHLNGYIMGFGTPPPKFDQFETKKAVTFNKKEYEFSIYNIVRFFELCRKATPNLIDTLFVDVTEQLKVSKVAQLVLAKRHLFLSKLVFNTFRGYAHQQIHKMKNKTPIGNRLEDVRKYGYPTKFAYHTVRLIGECEQLLLTGEMNLKLDRELLKSIRRGEWSEEKILLYFDQKLKDLDRAYSETKLPARPNEEELRELLLNCLEEHYGDLSIPHSTDLYRQAVADIKVILATL